MTTSMIPTAPTGTPPSTDTTATRVPQKTLDQNDFLQLLTVQLANQDPMQPMDDDSFIGQMAQFSALQESTTMSSTLTAMKASNDLTSASSLIGRKVTVTTSQGDVTGDVSGVDASSGSAQLEIAGNLYSLTAIKTIVPDDGSSTATAPTSTSTTPSSASTSSSSSSTTPSSSSSSSSSSTQ